VVRPGQAFEGMHNLIEFLSSLGVTILTDEDKCKTIQRDYRLEAVNSLKRRGRVGDTSIYFFRLSQLLACPELVPMPNLC
jgi:hypothetical protein